jgi:glycine oxidase
MARRLAGLGAVLVVGKGATGRKASWAAAGILTLHSEASSPDAFFRFGARSLCRYRSFVGELRDETGVDMEYRDNGLLLLASDVDTLDSIRLRQERQAQEGFDTVLVSPEEVSRMEPALTLELSGALFCPSDHHVRPRLLIDALRASCVLRGVEIFEGTGVDEIIQKGGRVQGVLAGGRTLSAPVVIVAAGAWASGIRGMDPAIEMCPPEGPDVGSRRAREPIRSRRPVGTSLLCPPRVGNWPSDQPTKTPGPRPVLLPRASTGCWRLQSGCRRERVPVG